MTLPLLAALIGSNTSHAETPLRTVEGKLSIPEGVATAEAVDALEDVAAVFGHYEPVVPFVPGVRLELEKQLVATEGPTVVELPVEGAAFGRSIEERARVAAVSRPIACTDAEGVQMTLDFDDSSWNIERRIDRIEIVACPRQDNRGRWTIHAVGEMYEGFLPIDPDKNALQETLGAKALQAAFIRQVPAVFSAVELHWGHRFGS